ncbi:MAG: hypothetical protein A2252_09060 [Elusimicrobia bacterium RIFOXYA2_FULL_39_19]|nr:MAG: hypothetical protein A2252_09060 [Elusimicrobia bacterium RIFOXYA2_FULL_39_19]
MADQNIPVTADGDVVIDCDNDSSGTTNIIKFSHDNGTELMRIQEDGKVGIGTNNPSVKLNIYDNAATSVYIDANGNDAKLGLLNAGSEKGFFSYLPDSSEVRIGGGVGLGLAFHTDNSEKLRITSGGLVGIGTNAPSALLEVRNGDIKIQETNDLAKYMYFYRNGSIIGKIGTDNSRLTITAGANRDISIEDDSGKGIFVKDGGNVGIGITDPSDMLEVAKDGDNSITIRAGDSNWCQLKFKHNTSAAVNGSIDYDNNNEKMNVCVSGGIRLSILSSGNVGIGTTTPGYKLDVAGDINTSGDIRKNGTAYNNPDYVFENNYELFSLNALKNYIIENKCLPNMPNTATVKKEGVKLFEQNRLILEKLEEAYLYIFQLEERLNKLETKN